MASWMKWVLVMIALCGAFGMLIVRTAPETVARAETRMRVSEQSRLRLLQLQLRSTSRALLQHAARDSVRHFLPETPGVALALRAPVPAGFTRRDPQGKVMQLAPEPSDSVIAAIEAAVATELRDIGNSRARIALVALPGLLESVPHSSSSMPVQYFAGQDSAGGWCAVVLGVYTGDEREILEHVLQGGSALGPCRLWARYGAPGAAVSALLPRGGHLLGAKQPSQPHPPATRRTLFGARRLLDPDASTDLRAQGCLAGREEMCLPALLDETQWESSFWLARTPEGPALLARAPMSRGAGAVEHLFADLERELGGQAFEAFWRAEGSAEDALGRSLEAGTPRWLRDWTRARYGVEPRGPSLDIATLALTLLTMSLLFGAAVAVARARRIA